MCRPFDKSRHARPDDNDEVGDKTRQMRAKIQGHSPILMTPFISLYEAADITKDRRPPTIHFPAGVCSRLPKERSALCVFSNCITANGRASISLVRFYSRWYNNGPLIRPNGPVEMPGFYFNLKIIPSDKMRTVLYMQRFYSLLFVTIN